MYWVSYVYSVFCASLVKFVHPLSFSCVRVTTQIGISFMVNYT